MRQGLLLTGLGIAVWGVATLFFRLIGSWVLVAPGEAHFGSSLFLLELLTLLILIGLAVAVRLKWFPERGSATRFGNTAAAIGLLLDTFSVWRRDTVFPAFSDGQHHAFTIWMTLGYALMLIVPAAVDRLIREKPAVTAADSPETDAQTHPAEEGIRDADADRTT